MRVKSTVLESLRRIVLFVACLLGAVPTGVFAQPLAIAAASDLQFVMPEVAARFERASGQVVTITFGSSGNFLSQIQNGAPFDLFLSADIDYPRRLEADGLAEAGSITPYAIGRLVLWVRVDSGLDVRRGLPLLLDPAVRRVAIANPAHAPYGKAAVAALRHEQLLDRVQGKLVLGENVTQAAQFVNSGNADAGLIALALALSPGLRSQGVYLEIPPGAHPPIEQGAAVIQSSRQKPAAHAFLAFLQSPDIIGLMQRYGLTPPSPAGQER